MCARIFLKTFGFDKEVIENFGFAYMLNDYFMHRNGTVKPFDLTVNEKVASK